MKGLVMQHRGLVLVSALLLSSALLVFQGCSTQNDTLVDTLDNTFSMDSPEAPAFVTSAGNGAPSGSHYNLNIIGVPKTKSADMKGGSGHRIFVPLAGNAKILLEEGATFQVLDANGTDGDGAMFQLPDPDPNDNLDLMYEVWARALGKPGGNATMQTCYTDALGDTYCSTEQLVLIRMKGKSSFTNVSNELLTVVIDGKRTALFADSTYQYFWDYDNNGLKLAQLRFYPRY